MNYKGVPTKDLRDSDNNERRFSIGMPNAQNEDEPFPESNIPQAHTKDSTPYV